MDNNHIISINKGIASKFDRIKCFDGEAVILPRVHNDSLLFLPCIIRGKDVEYVGPEDTHDIIIYHRLMGVMPIVSRTQFGRGNSKYNVRKTYSLIAFVDLIKVERSIDDLLVDLLSGFQDQTVTQINTNSLQVFQEEFNGSQVYFLRPEQIMVRITYTIEDMINLKCLNSNCTQ